MVSFVLEVIFDPPDLITFPQIPNSSTKFPLSLKMFKLETHQGLDPGVQANLNRLAEEFAPEQSLSRNRNIGRCNQLILSEGMHAHTSHVIVN